VYTIAYNRANGKKGWRAEAKASQLEASLKKEGSPAASTLGVFPLVIAQGPGPSCSHW
jgi:hypothetical protein